MVARHGQPSGLSQNPTWRLVVAPAKGTVQVTALDAGQRVGTGDTVAAVVARLRDTYDVVAPHGGTGHRVARRGRRPGLPRPADRPPAPRGGTRMTDRRRLQPSRHHARRAARRTPASSVSAATAPSASCTTTSSSSGSTPPTSGSASAPASSPAAGPRRTRRVVDMAEAAVRAGAGDGRPRRRRGSARCWSPPSRTRTRRRPPPRCSPTGSAPRRPPRSTSPPRAPASATASPGQRHGPRRQRRARAGRRRREASDFTDLDDRGTAFIFGDGAGAVVIGPSDDPGIGPTVWGSDGAQWDAIRQTRQLDRAARRARRASGRR